MLTKITSAQAAGDIRVCWFAMQIQYENGGIKTQRTGKKKTDFLNFTVLFGMLLELVEQRNVRNKNIKMINVKQILGIS